MCEYLVPPSRGRSNYYFRRAVPLHLRDALEKTEWSYSLRTKDRVEAKRRRLVEEARTTALIEAAEAQLMASAVDAPEAEEVPERNADADYLESLLSRQVTLAEQAAAEQALRRAGRLDLVADIMRRTKGETFAMSPEDAAIKDVIRVAIEADRRKRTDMPEPTKAAAPRVPVPLLDLFDAYVAERRTLAPSTVTGWRGYMRNLIHFLGHDDAGKVTPDDVIEWKDRLLVTRKRDGELLSKRTIEDGYLAAARAIFSWAAKNRKIGANPAADVSIRLTHADKAEKRDYTDAEARAVLAASLVPYEGRAAETTKLARRWVPWLCAYTGARVGEIGQLRGQDVTEIEGVWCLHITPEAGTVKTKRARIVPIHSHLIEMGFLAVAKAAGDAPIFYDPGQQRLPEANGRQHKKVGERLAKWVRDDVKITDPAVDPSHGWRHRFKSEAREEDIDREARDRLQGHAASTEGEKYGGWRVKALQREIEKLPRYNV